MIRIATCRGCRIDITYESEDKSTYTCPLCDKPLRSRKAYKFGPLSVPTPDEAIIGGGGSPSGGKIAIKEKQYEVLSDFCDVCGGSAGPYSLFRIGHIHYAACAGCFSKLDLVRLRRTKFSRY